MVMTEVERFVYVLNQMPPSANHLYTNGMRGRRVLSTEGAAFKTRVQMELGKALMRTPALNKQAPYRVEFHFELTDIFTESYGTALPSKPKKVSAANRFTKKDVSNLRKLLEDVLAKAVGVDDSTTCSAVTTKRWGPENKVTIIVTELPLGDVGWEASGRHVLG